MDNELHFLKYPGAVLSRQDIELSLVKGFLRIESSFPLNIQPASVDLHLARTVAFLSRSRIRKPAIDIKEPVDDLMDYTEIDPILGLTIQPRTFLLGVTREWFKFPAQLIGNLDGKSSLGRLGFVVHSTAGFFDPGFEGHATLEVTNLTEFPLTIYSDMPIGQMRFTVLSSPTEILYGDKALGSKYQNPYSDDPKPMPSQYWRNFLKEQNG